MFLLLSFEGVEGENREAGRAPEKKREYEPGMKKEEDRTFFHSGSSLLPPSLPSSLSPSFHPSIPPSLPPSTVLPPPIIFLPVLLSSEIHPEASSSPGWLAPPSTALVTPHAGNNSRPPKDPELLEGSASRRLPPPPPTVSSVCWGSLLHVPCAHLFPPLVPGWRAAKMQMEDKENERVCPERLHMRGKWREKDRRQGLGPNQAPKTKNSPQNSRVQFFFFIVCLTASTKHKAFCVCVYFPTFLAHAATMKLRHLTTSCVDRFLCSCHEMFRWRP